MKGYFGFQVNKSASWIYKNIWIYRLIMNILYLGRYRQRFTDIINVIGAEDRQIVELCFGDIYIAEYCKNSGRQWTGYDINETFVTHALNRGHHAVKADLLSLEKLPAADVLIFAGSLYHFNADLTHIWELMRSCSAKFILSEPIKNITSSNNFIGKIGARASTVGKGAEDFRYRRNSLLEMLNRFQQTYSFTYEIVSEKKDILIIIHERNQHRHSGL